MAQAAEGVYLDQADMTSALTVLEHQLQAVYDLREKLRRAPGVVHLDNPNTLLLMQALEAMPLERRNCGTEGLAEECRTALRAGEEPGSGQVAFVAAAAVINLLCERGVLESDMRHGYLEAAANMIRQNL